jgi:L-iditol 2-dehydrogenase
MRMKAWVLHAVGDLRFDEVAVPQPNRGEVLLKVKACGICGSDIPRVFTKGTYHFPTIPGHEFSGQVVEVGDGVNPGLIGQRAAVFPLMPCGECSSCQVGQYAQCENYNYLGSRCDGAFAEYVCCPVWNLLMIPEGLSFEEAAMVEPGAVAVHALRQGGIDIGDSVLIYGAGPIGLMLATWARLWGAANVLMVDIDEQKLTFARQQGFDDVFNGRDGDVINWVKARTGRGADVTIEGAGSSVSFEQCMHTTRPFGKVVLMGNPAGDMKLSQNGYWQILRKQLTVVGTWNSVYADSPKNEWKLVLQAMASGQLNVKPFITHKVAIEDVYDHLVMMRDGTAFYNKVMYTNAN